MENVRLQNYARELEEELRLRDEEDAEAARQNAELLASKDRQIAEQAVLIESQKKDITRITADTGGPGRTVRSAYRYGQSLSRQSL